MPWASVIDSVVSGIVEGGSSRHLARDIVVEVDASEDGRIPANVLFDASAMVR